MTKNRPIELWNWYQPNSEKLMSILATFDKVSSITSYDLLGHPYTTWSEKGTPHEITMNDHEEGREGSRNDHVVTSTDMFFAFNQQMVTIREILHLN